MNNTFLGSAMVFGFAGFAFACAGCASREVTVTGDAKAAEAVSGPIALEFFEVPSDEGEEATSIGTATLEKLGKFTETVDVDGDKIRIFALSDTDKNGACTAGELWDQVDVDVKEDKADGVTLNLKAAECPKVAADSK